MPPATPCPCGLGATYAACCEPLHDRVEEATTAERVMRSRYAAYAVRHEGYLVRTWHPRTRPEHVAAAPGTHWLGLQVVAVTGGGPEDEHGTVTFRATWSEESGGSGVLAECSAFVRRRGRWVYLEAVPAADAGPDRPDDGSGHDLLD